MSLLPRQSSTIMMLVALSGGIFYKIFSILRPSMRTASLEHTIYIILAILGIANCSYLAFIIIWAENEFLIKHIDEIRLPAFLSALVVIWVFSKYIIDAFKNY